MLVLSRKNQEVGGHWRVKWFSIASSKSRCWRFAAQRETGLRGRRGRARPSCRGLGTYPSKPRSVHQFRLRRLPWVILQKEKRIMNESNNTVREAARDVVVEILGALGIQPQAMDSHFGEESRWGRHRVAADAVRRRHFRASQAEAGDKIAPLERRLPTMNDPPLDDTVRARMQGIRCDIDQDLEDVSASARSMVDWKHYVKAYPWVCLGAAAALGFLIVPKRSAATSADLPTPTEPANTGRPAVPSAPTAAPRSVRCARGRRRRHRGSRGNRLLRPKRRENPGNDRPSGDKPS